MARRDATSRLMGWCLFASLTGLLAGTLGGLWPPFDILAHLRGHFAGAVIALSLALAVPRFRWSIVLFALLAVPAAPVVLSARAYETHGGPMADNGQSLRVLSLNMWGLSADPGRLEALLRHHDPDIVILAEFPRQRRHLLRDLSSRYPYQIDCDTGCRMALLSKEKWTSAGTQKRQAGKPRLVWAEFDRPTGPLTVLGVHLQKPITSPAGKRREIDWLTGRIAGLKGSVVLAGDLNSTPWSHNFRRLTAQVRLRRAPGLHPTWPVCCFLPAQLAIDHILASRDVTINRMVAGRRVGSDHLPVIGDLTLPKRAGGKPTR